MTFGKRLNCRLNVYVVEFFCSVSITAASSEHEQVASPEHGPVAMLLNHGSDLVLELCWRRVFLNSTPLGSTLSFYKCTCSVCEVGSDFAFRKAEAKSDEQTHSCYVLFVLDAQPYI